MKEEGMRQVVLCLLVSALFFSIPLFAQDRAAIDGVVTDSSGAVVPGATVDLESPATGFHRTALTGMNGLYQLTPLPVGSYSLKISKEGFKPTIINDVELEYAQTRTFDVKLEVGAVEQSVSVQAAAESVNRTNAEIAGVIDSAQIKEIPVSGRNWASLMMLAPGAINYGDGAQRSIRFSGHSLDDSNFTFDGIDTSG